MNLGIAMMTGTGGVSPSASAEYTDLENAYGAAAVNGWLVKRYGDTEYAMTAAATYAGLFSAVGDQFREPDFGSLVTYMGYEAINENSERAPIGDFNADGTVYKSRTGTRKWAYFDVTDGSFILDDTYPANPTHASNYMDAFYFHPSDPDLVIYPWGAELRSRNWRTGGSETTIRDFSGLGLGDIGDNNEKIAGGDGNTPRNGRFLLTFGGKWSNFLVYDFANDQAVISEFTGGNWVESLSSDFAASVFSISGVDDYATLDFTGSYIYAVRGSNTDLCMFDGGVITDSGGDSLHGDDPHFIPCVFGGNNAYLAMLNSGTATDYGLGVKDTIATTYTISWDGAGNRTATFTRTKLVDWTQSNGTYGGGQMSVDSTGTLVLIAMKPSLGASPNEFGYNELWQVDLGSTAYRCRRLGKHQIYSGTFDKQPEAWMIPDGSGFIFRSELDNEVNTDNKLFLVKTPSRATDQEIIDAGV